jgi:Flp pilus assembly protein TadB
MGIGLDLVNTLLLGAFLLVVIALVLDEFGRQMDVLWKRYRPRFLPSTLTWHTFLPLMISIVLAALMRALLISVYLIIVGLLVTLYFLRRARRAHESLPARQIFQLILAFRSMYQLQPSVFLTLDAVKDKVDEPLRGLMKVVVETFYLTSSPQRAFAELRARTDNVYLNQFAYILEMSETARADAVVTALDNLVERLRTHDQLRREIQASLTSITGQTSFIQALAVLVVLAVAAVPVLRAPYVPVAGQLFFVIVVTVMLVASYYIDRVINQLAERVS